MPYPIPAAESVVPTRVLRLRLGVLESAEDQLAVEAPLEFEVVYRRHHLPVRKSLSITMRTPGADEELAVGYLLTEGIIAGRHEISSVEISAAAGPGARATITLLRAPAAHPAGQRRRNVVPGSCGACSKDSLADLQRLPIQRVAAAGGQRIDSRVLQSLPSRLREAQTAFEQTGGLHAAALFDGEGNLLAVREDIGRHNAVDKVLGAAVLADRLPLNDHLLLVSGRVSFELVQKATAAGIALLAAIGAPSSLAVETASAAGMALVGFLSRDRFNIYTGASLVRFPATSAAQDRA